VTREAFDATIRKLTEFYRSRGGERVTGMVADTWFQMFATQETALFAKVIDHWIETSRSDRMPTPGDLRDMLENVRESDYLADKRKGYEPPPFTLETMTSKEEWTLNSQIIIAILDLHKAHHPEAIVRKPEYNDQHGHPSMEQWMQMGCPRTWSTLVDAYMDGLAGVWYSGSAAIVSWQREYLEPLREMLRGVTAREQPKPVA